MITEFFLNSFKPFIDFLLKLNEDLPINLRILKYNVSSEYYIARGITISFFLFVFLTIFSTVFFSSITRNPAFALTSALIISIGIPFAFLFIYLKLPSFRLMSLESRINKEMYDAIPIFSAFASDKTPLDQSIKSFVESNPNFLISKEFQEIYNLVKYGGLDIISAIDKKIETTPSKKLRNFLFGLLTIIKTGGSIKDYVTKVANDEIEEYRNLIRESSRKLALFFEIYIIAVVIGSLFLIIITSVFSLIQPIPNLIELQFFIVFFLVPIISLMMSKLLQSFIP